VFHRLRLRELETTIGAFPWAGGTRLYISGQGFSTSGNNVITLRPPPCEEGSSDYCQDLRLPCRAIDVIQDDSGDTDLTTGTPRRVSSTKLVCLAPEGPRAPPGLTYNKSQRLILEVFVDGKTKAACPKGKESLCSVFYTLGPKMKSALSFDPRRYATTSGGALLNISAYSRTDEISVSTTQRVSQVSATGAARKAGEMPGIDGENCDLLESLEPGLNNETSTAISSW